MTVLRAFLILLIFSSLVPLEVFGSLEYTWEGRGMWVWAWYFKSEDDIAKAFAEISSLNFNMIFFLVKDSENIYYNSSIRRDFEWDPLRVAVNEAHKLGLELHAWFVIFYDSWLAQNRPDLTAVDNSGNPSPNWTCPAKSEVRNYNLNLILEVVRNYDVDGIHLDYIRYEKRSYCYCDHCRAEFKNETGMDPTEIPPNYPTWVEWRVRQITSFVQEVKASVKGVKPNIKVSAAVRPTFRDARENRGQDWREWAEKRILDFLAPMTYTNKTSEFKEWVTDILGIVNWMVPIYAGIGLHNLTNVDDPKTSLLEQINATRMLGAQGQVLFNWRWLTYNETLHQQFIEALKIAYAKPAITPHKIDHTPPKIRLLSQNPNNIQPHQNVTIQINITDLESGPANVIIYYTTNNGLKWKTQNAVILNQTSYHSAIYVAQIPGMPEGTILRYKIIAIDAAGNKAIDDNHGQYYVYTVIPEIKSIALIIKSIALMLAFLTFASLVILALRHKRLK